MRIATRWTCRDHYTHPHRTEALFCYICGRELTVRQKRKCRDCGADTLSVMDRFCDMCGGLLDAPETTDNE